ncbi:hypothetical protein DIPPA_14624 [Diplonema papillatum]|nr:hypothetical protein DIPPA_14624 [Diplonema papillatum]
MTASPRVLERARQLQREEAESAVARAELQKLSKGPNNGTQTMLKELELLERERTALLKKEVHVQAWNKELAKRLAPASPRVQQIRERQPERTGFYSGYLPSPSQRLS